MYQKRYGSLDVRKKSTPNDIFTEGDTSYIQCYNIDSTPSKKIIIDTNDVPIVLGYKWSVRKDRYARTTRKNGSCLYLHRLLLNFPKNKVDHVNRDPLDNRRSNLRVVTDQQNCWNSTYKKGFYRSKNGGYVARIKKDGKVFTKTLRTEKEAIEWRIKLLKEHYGEYAPIVS